MHAHIQMWSRLQDEYDILEGEDASVPLQPGSLDAMKSQQFLSLSPFLSEQAAADLPGTEEEGEGEEEGDGGEEDGEEFGGDDESDEYAYLF